MTYPFSVHLWEVSDAIPYRSFDLEESVGTLWTDIRYREEDADPLQMDFLYIFTLCNKSDNTLVRLITAERASIVAELVGVGLSEMPLTLESWDQDGNRCNHGVHPEIVDLEVFAEKCLTMVRSMV